MKTEQLQNIKCLRTCKGVSGTEFFKGETYPFNVIKWNRIHPNENCECNFQYGKFKELVDTRYFEDYDVSFLWEEDEEEEILD